jgi:UDP-glucose 4-epimerase
VIVASSLVTGGAGFIGSHLVEALVAAGHPVRVLDDFSTGRRENLHQIQGRVEIIEDSLTDPAAVDRAVQGCSWVFHLGALPSVTKSIEDPVTSHAITATGTLHVLDAARRHKARRVIYAASSSAYGNAPGAVRTEDDPLTPLSPYAAAKLAGEHYCQCFTAVYGLETVRLRFFNVFGPRQDPKSPYSGVIAIFTDRMRAGQAPRVDGDGLQSRDFVPVANVVQALLRAATAPGASGGVYNIGNGASITVLDLVHQINQVLGTNIPPTFGPPRAGDVRYSQADISRARRDLGYEPTMDFATGLRLTLESP